ncbi:cytochrome P450 94A2-like [Solanum dulcamara]|uniref:cytochrome P450 94A2-like n=1 Tax=Solanum dulcamara TaxID=45834 RepID=UPI0024851105|nr:cytochrome P450 94A2-like [Solanum dulcamara]
MLFNFDLPIIFSHLYFFFLLLVIFLLFFIMSISRTMLTNLFIYPKSTKIPRSYPIIGSYFSIKSNKNRRIEWTSEIVLSTLPSLTFTLYRPLGHRHIFTANPSNVQHILKTYFHNYQKGYLGKETLKDLLGNGIFNADGEVWKYQRKLASHEFNSKSLRKFVENVVDVELSDRLIPILTMATSQKTVLDIQDLLQRFAFDNICMVAYGYDPTYLLPSFPETKFANAFEEVVRISSERFNSFSPFIWKLKRFLNVGSEKKLRVCATQIRDMATEMIKQKKEKSTLMSSNDDLLSRFLTSSDGQHNMHSEEFITDIVISFILAGRDTTSAALTWFFWLISKYPKVEKEILEEITNKTTSSSTYDEVTDMAYTHASLCESMRLYPPVPVDTKEAMEDDILPDGTFVNKGTRISYHPYAMGRVKDIWGKDWQDFRPERWLERDIKTGNWKFVPRDPFVYPVFQAGPRVCLGKEMSFLQMKKVVAGVLRRFRFVPVVNKGEEPVLIAYLTIKVKGGLMVRVEERTNSYDTLSLLH